METLAVTINEDALASGIIGGMIAFTMMAGLAYSVLMIIAGWKVFEKAGERGWKTLIPIYNTYIFYKIVGMKKWFWATFLMSFAVGIVLGLTGQGNQPNTIDWSTGAGVFSAVLVIAMCILALVVGILYSWRTARAFGHGAIFAVGLFFLSGIFMLILGLGSSKYDKKLVKSWEK